MPCPISPQDITGLVLAGGRGSRMGGVDKGLQPFCGQPLAQHALRRLQPQVGALLLSANRHLAQYQTFGVPVHADSMADHPGPLAGFLTGLQHSATPWILTVPCDTPHFPPDLAARLAAAAMAAHADIAMAASCEADPATGQAVQRRQPVFCLLRATLRDSLAQFMAGGGRKVGQWTAQHACTVVPFNQWPGDARAFANANTLNELLALERGTAPPSP